MVVSFVGMVIFHVSRKDMDSLLSEDDRKKVQDAITVLKNLSEGNEASSSSSGRHTGASSSGVGASSGRPSGASSSGTGASSGKGASSAVSGTSGSKSTGDVDSPSCSGILNRVVLSN